MADLRAPSDMTVARDYPCLLKELGSIALYALGGVYMLVFRGGLREKKKWL